MPAFKYSCRMNRQRLLRIACALAAGAASLALAQDVVVPNANLTLQGIPPIPAALAATTALYTEFRPRSLASWHPVKRELVVTTRATNTVQLFNVASPLAPLVQLTDYAEPVRFGACASLALRPQARRLRDPFDPCTVELPCAVPGARGPAREKPISIAVESLTHREQACGPIRETCSDAAQAGKAHSDQGPCQER